MIFRCSPARADAGGLPRELPTRRHLYERDGFRCNCVSRRLRAADAAAGLYRCGREVRLLATRRDMGDLAGQEAAWLSK